MGAALDVVQQGYAAFGSKDIPTLLKLVADQVDWKEICPASLPYSGLRRTPSEVGEFFSAITKVEDVTVLVKGKYVELRTPASSTHFDVFRFLFFATIFKEFYGS
jgi:ketosteroid isomerase-like protein